jgi:hypothetical protein
MVWQVVPQKDGEFVYSQPTILPETKISVRTPRVTYGRINTLNGESGAGKKNFLSRSRIFLMASPFWESKKDESGKLVKY